MHAKIEKIALESGIALGNNVAEGSRRELLNKFAEMIIRECADIALREDHDPYECILKEFGIEKKVSRCEVCDCMYPCGASRRQNNVDSYWR